MRRDIGSTAFRFYSQQIISLNVLGWTKIQFIGIGQRLVYAFACVKGENLATSPIHHFSNSLYSNIHFKNGVFLTRRWLLTHYQQVIHFKLFLQKWKWILQGYSKNSFQRSSRWLITHVQKKAGQGEWCNLCKQTHMGFWNRVPIVL